MGASLVLAMPATSADVERLFSIAGDRVRPRSASMTAATVRKLVLLKKWLAQKEASSGNYIDPSSARRASRCQRLCKLKFEDFGNGSMNLYIDYDNADINALQAVDAEVDAGADPEADLADIYEQGELHEDEEAVMEAAANDAIERDMDNERDRVQSS